MNTAMLARGLRRAGSGLTLVFALTHAHAADPGLTAIDDSSLAEVTGEGIAMALQDFRLATDPHSYIEAIGTTPPSGAPFKLGNGRWYGLSLTGTGAGTMWNGSACTGSGDLSCPIGTAGVPWLAPFDNPFILRVFNYNKINYQGASQDWTVFESLMPTNHDPFRQAFWGEIEALNGDGSVAGVLQSQAIMANVNLGGTRVRLFQTANTADPTLGLTADWRLKGDFRFSVAQTADSANTIKTPPKFDNVEGMYFKNVDTFLPLGQLHYQAVTLNDLASADDGNFVVELTPISSSQSAIYNDFYSLNSGDSTGYTTARAAITGGTVSARYRETHGYVRWGDFSSANAATASNDGIYFGSIPGGTITASAAAGGNEVYDYNSTATGWYARPVYSDDARGTQNYSRTKYSVNYGSTAPNGAYVNIGDARIEGLLLQHLKITSCSAGLSSPC